MSYQLTLGNVLLRPFSSGHTSGVNPVNSSGKDLTLRTGESNASSKDSFG